MLIKSKKLIVLMLAIICFCVNVSLVSAASNSDCEGFGRLYYSNQGGGDNGFEIVNIARGVDGYKYSSFLSTDQQNAIMDKESLNTAILNLKKYCCENGLGGLSMTLETCSKDKEFYNDNIIDSPYLFDHLLDVEMRRLSGLTGEFDIYKKTNMGSDDKGLEWRAWLNEQAENVSGANPQIVMDKYKEFWQQSSPDLKYNIAENLKSNFSKADDVFLSYVSGTGGTEESEAVANALKNYDKWTLYDRYNNACAITEYFYSLLNLGPSSKDKEGVITKLSKGLCDKIVEDQIKNENSYVQSVILKAGNLFLKNYRQGYISYLNDRSKNLNKIWSDATDRLLDVVRGVPHLVKTCVK